MPLPQRRYVDINDIQPVIEVLPKLPDMDTFLEVFIGGGNHTEIDFYRLAVADPLELVVLEYMQQLGL